MIYTKLQIQAALVVSDYHSKIGNVTAKECDIAVCEMDGAPLSAVLAWALRQSIADTARLDYLETTKGWRGHADLVHSDGEGPGDNGGWRVTTSLSEHETARAAIDFSMAESALPNA
jgi:hypothetical protein